MRAGVEARARAWREDAAAPPDLSPTAVVTLAQRAIDDARDVTTFVAQSYGGTAPPPPWPASPEMIASAKKVQASRDASEVIVRRAPAAKFKDPARVRAILLRDGGELYAGSVALLQKVESSPRVPDFRSVLPDPLDFLKGLPTYVVVLGLWWFLEGGRRQKGTV